ncbi:MAG: lipoate--protein ligase family protein [Deltaproteobacteria bacterium]|nr:lipoate--protein ligase family protein [Deltaproteobacteria bacterium]
MKYLDLTFAEPARNLACDEALLESCENDFMDGGLLRVWQPKNYFVVLGHSNRLAAEANVTACGAAQIPILRRVSGGGAVVLGPGCLNYSLILDAQFHEIKNIAGAFDFVLQRHRQLIESSTGREIAVSGVSDLTIGGRKFSGNSQYRKARYVLVHGTFLVKFDLAVIERCLLLPPKQPEYRDNRRHLEFVANLELSADHLVRGLRDIWQADSEVGVLRWQRTDELTRQKYGRSDWTNKF